MSIILHFPDPDFEASFRAYLNYFEDLAGSIGGRYGWEESLVEGVLTGVALHPPVARIHRRQLTHAKEVALDQALRKAWGALRRAHHEVDDPESYDDEANAWLPVQCYYSVYHAVLAFALASGQTLPRDHAATLKLIGKDVRRELLPYPWSVACEGCPQIGGHAFVGLTETDPVHVLSNPDPSTSEDRLAMFLRTTRTKELERRFDIERRKARPGRSRRNLSTSDKERIAAAAAPTTLFDIFWRMRKKASYEDADAFVLGAAGELDARRFGESLVIVTDATVTALEAIMAAYVGPDPLARLVAAYMARSRSAADSVVGRHAAAWGQRAQSISHA